MDWAWNCVLTMFMHKSFSHLFLYFIKLNEGIVCVLCENLYYIVHNPETNDSYLCRWEVKDAGGDSKSHVCRSVLFKGLAASVSVQNPTHCMYIPKAKLSQSSLWECNKQSTFLPTSVHFLRKWINPVVMLSTCQRSRWWSYLCVLNFHIGYSGKMKRHCRPRFNGVCISITSEEEKGLLIFEKNNLI